MTLSEKLLQSASRLRGDFSQTQLTLAAWRDNPADFGLKGVEADHPDSHKVCWLLSGVKGLIRRGYIRKRGDRLYVTTAGLHRLEQLRKKRELKEYVQLTERGTGNGRAYDSKVLSRMKESRVWSLDASQWTFDDLKEFFDVRYPRGVRKRIDAILTILTRLQEDSEARVALCLANRLIEKFSSQLIIYCLSQEERRAKNKKDRRAGNRDECPDG